MTRKILTAICAIGLAFLAAAQPGAILSGTVSGWQDGDAEVVLLLPRHIPPPYVRPADAPVIGSVASDGSLTIAVPERFPPDEFVPVADFLDPGCTELSLAPESATYFPIAYGVYRDNGSLIGEVFLGNRALADAPGPVPGGYSLLHGYADQPFSLQGQCEDPRRRVIEDYDVDVEAGWHDVVQRFEDAPDREGWRIDRWRAEAVPEDAVWLLLRP